jgi:hypothetical protein
MNRRLLEPWLLGTVLLCGAKFRWYSCTFQHPDHAAAAIATAGALLVAPGKLRRFPGTSDALVADMNAAIWEMCSSRT